MNLEELKAKALAATPGPWATLLLANGADVRAPHASGGSTWVAETRSNADADYIAHANPSAILKLVAVVEAAKAFHAAEPSDTPEGIAAHTALGAALNALESA